MIDFWDGLGGKPAVVLRQTTERVDGKNLYYFEVISGTERRKTGQTTCQ